MPHLLRFAHICVLANIIYDQDLRTWAMLVNATFAFDFGCFANVERRYRIDKCLLLRQSLRQICWYERFCARGKNVQRHCIELVCSTCQNRSKLCNCQCFTVGGERPSKFLHCTDLLGAVNVFKELLLRTFALGCKTDQRLKNDQIYYVGQIAVITHIYFDFTGCRKGDQCLRITHLLMLQ